MTALAVSLGILARGQHRVPERVAGAALGALLVLVALLKGTTPGGRRARRAFEATRQATARAAP